MTITLSSSDAITSSDPDRVHHKTLSTYYPRVAALGSYIQHATGSDWFVLYSDPAEYKALLRDVLVATYDEREGIGSRSDRSNTRWNGQGKPSGSVQAPMPKLGRCHMDHQEAVDLIMQELTNRARPDVLCASAKTNHQFPVNAARPGYQNLLGASPGDAAFRHLLLSTSLFVPLGNNCFMQLAGYPIYELYRPDPHRINVGSKRKAGKDDSLVQTVKRSKRTDAPADKVIGRAKMFYGRPPRLNNVLCYGLPHRHPLNGGRIELVTEATCHDLLRSIFPTSSSFKDIISGNPKRLQKMTEAAGEMMARHAKVKYDTLLRRCEYRMKLADYYDQSRNLRPISHSQVCRFIVSVLRQIFSTLVGEHNMTVVARHARSVVCAKIYEPINLHTLMQGLRVNDISWIKLDDGTRVNAAEANKRRELMERFVFWIFDDFLISLLRTSFYITETADTQYETVYYTHSAWGRATGPHFRRLQRDLLAELGPHERQISSLGVSSVRLIPKPTGFRPIVNLGKQARGPNGIGVTISGPKSSVNQVLKPVHQVLTYEKNRQRNLLGSSLFGTNEIFAPIQSLKQELLDIHGTLPRLYFVKMDIKAAFDSIKQDKMLQVIDRLLAQDQDYCLITYALLLPPASKASQGSSRRLFKTKAVIDGALSTFDEHAKEIAQPLRNAVVVDLLRRRQLSRDACMDLLRTHIGNNIWQVGTKLYRQKTGIPQGSTISSLLCSVLYAALEEDHLSFVHQRGSRLLRYIDDFMLITGDYTLARRFIDTMSTGFPEYGAFVSPTKTLVSFEHAQGDQVAPVAGLGPDGDTCNRDGVDFPFCGFLVSTRTLNLGIDVTKMLATPTRQSFSLRSSRRRGSAFVAWFSRQLENRNHVGYLDTAHNDLTTVYHNIFVNVAMSTMKVPHYFPRPGLNRHQAKQVFKSLCLSAEYTYVAGRARVKHASRADRHNEHFAISKRVFMHLAVSAMHEVLSRKVARFKYVVRLLRERLNADEELASNLKQPVERGWQTVRSAKY